MSRDEERKAERSPDTDSDDGARNEPREISSIYITTAVLTTPSHARTARLS